MSVDGKEYLGEEEEEDDVDFDAYFEFFLELAKPLVLDLPSEEDNVLAAAWITRLSMNPETDDERRLRVDYLKLLLFVMQRGRLIGLFKNEPPKEPLQPFPEGFGLTQMGNHLLEEAELQGTGDAGATGVSYSVEISNDLKEFVAAQEIPDFGVQVYYAWSMEEPIHKWSSFDDKKFPRYVREKIRQLKVLNSEEKTNVQTSSYVDSSMRKSCVSSIYYKTKTKVKSPQEIERSLERNCYSLGITSPQGSSKEDDKDCMCGKRSRSPSKKCSPGVPRKMDQDSEEDGRSDLEDSSGGVKGHGQVECYCRQSKQDPELSKRIHSGSRNSDTKGRDMFADSERCIRDKPLCPAAELYLINQAKQQMKKKKSPPQGHVSQQQSSVQSKSGSYPKPIPGKTCSAPPSARPPCTCSCPREETKDSPSPKKKTPLDKNWSMIAEASTECSQIQSSPGEDVEEAQFQQAILNCLHHIDGCNCLDGIPSPKNLEGLEKLGFPKPTPDPCIKDVKQSRPADKTYAVTDRTFAVEGKKSQEKSKNINLPCPQTLSPTDGSTSPSFKSRTRIISDQVGEVIKKASSCPPPRTRPFSEINPIPIKSMTQDMYGPMQSLRPGYMAKYPTVDLGACPPQAYGERQFQSKRYQECPGDEEEEEDIGGGGAGYSSSSDNVGQTSGSPYVDERSSDWPKSSTDEEGYQQSPGAQQQPFFLNQQGLQFPMGFAAGNVPFAAPPNSPNNKQPGQYPIFFGGGNQFGQANYSQSDSQGTYYSSSYTPSSPYCPIDQATYTQAQQFPTFTMPGGPAHWKSYGPSQIQYRTPAGRQAPLPGPFSAPMPQTRPMEGRPGRMQIDPRDFPQNLMPNYPIMPTMSTPHNMNAPPAPPRFLLSPITNSPETQWVRLGAETQCPRSPRPNAKSHDGEDHSNPEWMSLRSEHQSMMGRSSSRPVDQSSEIQGDYEPDSLMRYDQENTSMACQYGSYYGSPKWTELPKCSRIPKKNINRSTFM